MVAGVVMFDSPEDAAVNLLGDATASAQWLLSTQWATPLAHYYGLTHEQDEFASRISLAWQNLGKNAPGGGFAQFASACVDSATSAAPKGDPGFCAYLVERPGRAVSRDQIAADVMPSVEDARTIDAHVARIRKKLGASAAFVATVWGIGYRFEPGAGAR